MIFAIIAVVAVLASLAIIFVPRLLQKPAPEEDAPLVNPTGREASSEYTEDTTDPDLRASEQDKLNTVIALVNREDWEYANALLETIFPAYLELCQKYEYYRAAQTISEHIPDFSITPDYISSRIDELEHQCRR